MFRLHDDARKFFKGVDAELGDTSKTPLFDKYYFSFVTGVMTARERQMTDKDGKVFIDNFPGAGAGGYRDRTESILALLLAAELRKERIIIRSGAVDAVHKLRVQEAVGKILDPRSPSYLKPEGAERMNAYAAGGIQVLEEEWFEEPPKSLDFFLMRFKEKLDNHAASFSGVFLTH